MDLSVFLILFFVTFQFVAEYSGWNQYQVKLGVFIATLILTLPNLIFMVIEWLQSPHSKIALLVLNTFKPILRGETYRLFRWLKTVRINLSSDDLNHLPISKLNTDSFEFYMTRECFEQSKTRSMFKVIFEEIDVDIEVLRAPELMYTKCTSFTFSYENGSLVVYQFRLSKQLLELWKRLRYNDFISHPSIMSRLERSPAYYNVDIGTATQLVRRLGRICYSEMPILTRFKLKREWCYF